MLIRQGLLETWWVRDAWHGASVEGWGVLGVCAVGEGCDLGMVEAGGGVDRVVSVEGEVVRVFVVVELEMVTVEE